MWGGGSRREGEGRSYPSVGRTRRIVGGAEPIPRPENSPVSAVISLPVSISKRRKGGKNSVL